MLSLQLIPLAVLLGSACVFAVNDWSKPCFQGECSYDLPASNGASGSLKIWGSPNAITDITAAAGWTILGCEKDALAQDIRLICNDGDTTAAGCSHLYQNIGAVGKLVRLPENCGKSAFARVVKAWIPEDQTIPADLARHFIRRDGSTPEVRALGLDTNFAAVDPEQTGEVNIAIQGSTVPGDNGDLTVTPPTSSRRRRSRHSRRGLLSLIEDAFNKFNSFDESVTKNLPPLDVSETFPIFSQSISCPAAGDIPAFGASINADVVAKAHAVITLGVAAAGTIVPPKLTDFGLFAGIDAQLDGTLEMKGNATGKADLGQITFFQVGIPGLDFPGILSIGPTFKILGQATATLDIGVDMKVDLSYSVNNAKLFFPPSENHPSGGKFSPSNNPLKLSVSPSLASKAVVAAHLIPRLDVGVSALGGIASATVFLDLDSSASVTMTLNAAANADASASVDGCVDAGAALNVNAGAQGSFFSLFDQSTKVNLFTKDFEIFKQCFGSQKRDLTRQHRNAKLMYRRDLSLECPTAGVVDLVSVA